MVKKIEDMSLDELEILCNQKGVPCKDAKSRDELIKRLKPKPPK